MLAFNNLPFSFLAPSKQADYYVEKANPSRIGKRYLEESDNYVEYNILIPETRIFPSLFCISIIAHPTRVLYWLRRSNAERQICNKKYFAA